MAISTAVCSSFKQELLGGVHDLDTDTLKMALFTSSATLDATTTVYSASNEASGTGYTAGGETITTPVISLDGTTAIFDFDDVTWTSASFTAAGALIYNTSQSNKAIATISFGGDYTVSSGTFTVVIPAAAAATAIIKIA